MSREQQNEVSKERILKAALEEFGQKDYVSASTNAICKKHEISKGLLFHYYKSKDELFLVCVEKCFNDLSDFLQVHCVGDQGGVEEILNHYFKVRFEFFRESPHYAQIFNTATLGTPEHLILPIQKLKSSLKQTNEAILINMLDRLDLKENISPKQVVEMILGFADYLQIKGQVELEKQNETLTQMIEMLLYGIVKG